MYKNICAYAYLCLLVNKELLALPCNYGCDRYIMARDADGIAAAVAIA